MQSIHTLKAPAAIGPYSQAVLRNDFVFVSGQIGIEPHSGQIPLDFVNQAHQVFANLQAILEAAGTGFSHVVQVTVFLKDINDFTTLNGIYEQSFSAPYPARDTIQAARIPKDGLIEVSLIAVK